MTHFHHYRHKEGRHPETVENRKDETRDGMKENKKENEKDRLNMDKMNANE